MRNIIALLLCRELGLFSPVGAFLAHAPTPLFALPLRNVRCRLGPTPPQAAGNTEPLVPSGGDEKPLPTIREIAMFSGPALALWISSPLLSVIDSSAVGLSGGASSAMALAAMGPGTTVMDGSTYLFAFLNVATTNLLATATANGDRDEVQLVMATAKRYALRCGLGVMALLLVAAPYMLTLYVGSGASGVIGPASNYIRIRALAMPVLLLSNALQAALLGSKDSITPLLALGIAAVLNGFGDLVLVFGAKWGLAGAAIATVASQIAGLMLLVKASAKTLPPAKEGSTATPEARKAMSKRFLAFCPPVLLVVIGKMATFGFMTHVASCLPPASMAAHQIALSTFFLLATFSETSSQTFQAFLPQFEYSTSVKTKHAAKQLVWKLQSFAAAVGLAVATVGGALATCGAGLFTADPAVAAALQPLALPLFFAAALHSLICSAEGVLLVRKDLGFLGQVYSLSAVVMPLALLALKQQGAGLRAVWDAFVVFQATRVVILNCRVHLKTDRPTAAA